MFFAALCVVCSALGAQVFYEGQGGRNLGGIRIGEIKQTGLSNEEMELPTSIQADFIADFMKYANMTVASPGDTLTTRYILTGTITKIASTYQVTFLITDTQGGTVKTSFPTRLCTTSGYQIFQVIKDASEELITGMGIVLTQAGRNELRRQREEWRRMANADSQTEWGKQYYTYTPKGLDPKLVENARLFANVQVQNYRAPEFNFEMPVITTPVITVPQFNAPEIKMIDTGNIGDRAREQREIFNAQREESRRRQESGNKAMEELKAAFRNQFQEQSNAVKNQQANILKQRDILLNQQKTLLTKQRQLITQLRETENYFDTFFTEHPPFEIIYDPEASQIGLLDGVKGIIDMQFSIATVGTQTMEVIPPVLTNITNGLGTITQGLTDINAEFDKLQSLLAQVETAGNVALVQLVGDYAAQMREVEAAEKDYAAQLAKMEMTLNTIGYAQIGRDYAIRPDTGYAERLAIEYAVKPSGYNATRDKTQGDSWGRTKWLKDETRTFDITARLLNAAGRTIGTADVRLTNRIPAASYTQPLSADAVCVFRAVPVNDITDTLTVSIQSVNRRNITVAANTGYIKITPLEADGYTKDGWDIDGYDRNGYTKGGWDRGGYNRDGYDKDGWDWTGYGRDGYNRLGYDKDGYHRTGYDKEGYDRNGRNRSGLTRREVARLAENAAKKAARQERIQDMWGYYFGLFIGGGSSIGPWGGEAFEGGIEWSFNWLVFDSGLGSGSQPFYQRFGAAIPINFEWGRLNIGGGYVYALPGDTTVGYAGAKLNILFTPRGGLMGFISYRYEFPPAMRHVILAGLEYRDRSGE
ncbi:hypothetical protein AGMMS49928_24990 [Spirochaetia bacterium]|nr:hypothetical protein AGMMS49928_24990 [Spirochaetia bacterium]